MKVRIGVGTGALDGDPAGLATLVDDLEAFGFDSLWLPEVLSAPTALGRIPGLHQSAARTLPPPWKDRSVARVLADQIARRRPDVVHAHGWCAVTSSAVARASVLIRQLASRTSSW